MSGLKKIIFQVNRHGVKIIKGKSSRVNDPAGDPSSTTKSLNLRENLAPFPQVKSTVLPRSYTLPRDGPRDMQQDIASGPGAAEKEAVSTAADVMLNLGKPDKVNVRNISSDNSRSFQGEKEFDNPTLTEMTRELKGRVPDEADEALGATSWITPEEFERVMSTGLPPEREEDSAHVPSKKGKEKR